MEKVQFITILNNYTALTREEAESLINLQNQYPYSQVLHNLSSRAAQDLKLDRRDELLHRSAIYSTERSVLKSLMTAKNEGRVETKNAEPPSQATIVMEDTPVIPVVTKKTVTESKVVSPVSVAGNESVSSEALRNDLVKDMKRLQEMKSRFEDTLAKLENQPKQVPTEELLSKKPKKVVSTLPPEALIEEIKTKKKVKPEGPKQVEQGEIIDNFIKTQPSLAKNKLGNIPQDGSDLAEEALQEGDHIVSETLVEILLKQGRKDKAIEVLKKLIWKIPQKKAYFAAQIEELKK